MNPTSHSIGNNSAKKDLFYYILENSDDIIIITDTKGCITQLNACAQKVLLRSDAIGRPLDELLQGTKVADEDFSHRFLYTSEHYVSCSLHGIGELTVKVHVNPVFEDVAQQQLLGFCFTIYQGEITQFFEEKGEHATLYDVLNNLIKRIEDPMLVISDKLCTLSRKLDQSPDTSVQNTATTSSGALKSITFAKDQIWQLLSELKKEHSQTFNDNSFLESYPIGQTANLLKNFRKSLRKSIRVNVDSAAHSSVVSIGKEALNCLQRVLDHVDTMRQENTEILLELGVLEDRKQGCFTFVFRPSDQWHTEEAKLNLKVIEHLTEAVKGHLSVDKETGDGEQRIRITLNFSSVRQDSSISRVRILNIAQSPAILESTAAAVKEQTQVFYDFQSIDTMVSASAMIATYKPHLIVIDAKLDTEKVLTDFLREISLSQEHITIVIISEAPLPLEHRLYDAGKYVRDFINLAHDNINLKLGTHIKNCEHIIELSKRAKNAHVQSITDGLTGLFNRRYFDRVAQIELDKAFRYKSDISMIIIDVDSFKHYNDTNGHIFGDQVLRQFAIALKNQVRFGDIVARFGGEEFVVLLPGTNPVMAAKVAEKLRREIEKQKFTAEEKQPLGRITASFGVSSFGFDGNTPNELISAADERLYQAKSLGRNRVCAAPDAEST